MIFAMTSGILYAFVLLIVMARLGMRKFMGYPALCDLGGVFLLAFLLHGTLGGMTAAISGGLFFSLAITLIRKYWGYSRFTRRGWVVKSTGVISFVPKGEDLCFWNSKLFKPWPIFIALLFLALFVL